MRKKTDNNIATILSSLLILMLVVLVIGFFYIRTDNLTTGIKSFYVKNGGNTFYGDYVNFNVSINKEYKFDIVNTLDILTKNESNYNVKIVPNTDESASAFTFQVDSVDTKFNEITSLSDCFTLIAYDDYFTLKVTDDLPNILQNKYYGKTLANVPTAIDSGLPYFRLVVSSLGDDIVTININFNIKSE